MRFGWRFKHWPKIKGLVDVAVVMMDLHMRAEFGAGQLVAKGALPLDAGVFNRRGQRA